MEYSIYINGKYHGFTEDDDIESFAREYYPHATYEVKEDKLYLRMEKFNERV
jgi:hypothetical protein